MILVTPRPMLGVVLREAPRRDLTAGLAGKGTDRHIDRLKNQLMAGAMSQGGDSGSAVLDMDRKVIGLLFAGSTSTTIMNPIQLVLDALQVQVVTD